jgi:glutaredoxin
LFGEVVGLQETIVMYTHPDCGYSDAARDEFLQNDITFREIDLSVTPEAWQEVERLTGGERITPVIVEGDLVTVGFHGVG